MSHKGLLMNNFFFVICISYIIEIKLNVKELAFTVKSFFSQNMVISVLWNGTHVPVFI